MTQQVNLYRVAPAATSTSRSTRLLLLAGIVSAVAVLGLAAVGELHLAQVRKQHDATAANLERQRADVARLRGSLVAPPLDPFLESELSALRAQLRVLNANLVAIDRERASASRHFSAFFASLARNHVPGLWFSNVGLSAGGSEVLLKGKTTQPALVPRLLQTLAGEQAFAGRTFRRVTFQREDDGDGAVVGFELRSANAAEDGDAG